MAAITRLSLDGYGAKRTGSFAGKSSALIDSVFLYLVELSILPSSSGTVQLQAVLSGGATQVIIRQGSIGTLIEAV